MERDERVVFGVLGPTVAVGGDGRELALKGPRHRAVLARLIVARRRVVPVARLVEDLWTDPPPGAVGAVQTFVAALRRALEPDRPPRAPAGLLVTDGPGYALRAAPDTVDAWRFETAVAAAAGLPAPRALATLEEALSRWRGPAYAEFAGEDWSRAERARLAELRLQAVERRAEVLLALGRPADAVPDLDAHLTDHPWRENAWRLLALSLYRHHRQGDALAVLRRARTVLVTQLGVDPGPSLRSLEQAILTHSPTLTPPSHPPQPAPAKHPSPPLTQGRGERRAQPLQPAPDNDPPADLWTQAAEAYNRTVAGGARTRLDSTVALIRNLAVTGGAGLEEARRHRPAAIAAAEEFADPELTARVIGAYDVPAIWTRSDDPATAALIVAAAERTLTALPAGPRPEPGPGRAAGAGTGRAAGTETGRAAGPETGAGRAAGPETGAGAGTETGAGRAARTVAGAETGAPSSLHPTPQDTARCRLLTTVALETRGSAAPRGPEAAREAEALARRLDDPALLAFALNGTFMQSFTRAGLAPRRDEIGAELVALAARHGLVTYEVLGHLIRLQARAALGDLPAADLHAAAADRLAERHELPLVGVFTEWYGALRLSATGHPARAETAYRAAATRLEGAGMPGLRHGLLPLALLCLRLTHGLPPVPDPALRTDWGPYRPWAQPFTLLAAGRRTEARTALRTLPEPPRDHLYEACCALEAEAARRLDDRAVRERARERLRPAAAEHAGAGSGLLTLGPVERYLTS